MAYLKFVPGDRIIKQRATWETRPQQNDTQH